MSAIDVGIVAVLISESAIDLYKTFNSLNTRVYSTAQKALLTLKTMISLTMIAFVSSWSAGYKVAQSSETLFFVSGMLFLIQQFINERLDKSLQPKKKAS
ncbi:MAG TPA: hypothetical protein P5048_04195 [Chlamydiales bacterium]|nr:hypothetical protein [Chlamydiales bacterium]